MQIFICSIKYFARYILFIKIFLGGWEYKMKKNFCRVLVVALLLTSVFAISNLDSLLNAFKSISTNSDSNNNVVNAKSTEENYLSLELDKNKAQVGEIILAKVNVYDIGNLAGFQINIKYDPEILEPVNPDTGDTMKTRTMPKDGDIIVNDNYSVITMASNDLKEGILNFGKTYTYFDAYRKTGNAERTGTLAVIGFKVLKEEPTSIGFEDSVRMPNSICGTLMYDWEGNRITNYTTSQPSVINVKNSEGSISLELDRNSVSVGDIINAVIKINDVDCLSAYQLNIKYDPEFLQPVVPDTLNPYNSATVPDDGTLIANEEYGPFSVAANNIEEGILNFGKSYSFLSDYRISGKGEGSTGTLGTIGFKVLKEGNTSISFADTITMPNSIFGTMLFDWNGNKITSYSVIQPETITISQSTETPVETPEPQEPIKPADAHIIIKLDKTSAKVGEIIKAYINVSDITDFAAYQLNIKYDPNVLEAVDVNTGEPFGESTAPSNGDILDNSEYGIISLVDNDISNGILNFGKTYTYMEEFRNSGEAEESGTIGVIGFKVLSEESTNIRFEKTNTMPNSISGTYLYNWYGERITDYTVIQPKTINPSSDVLENNVSIVVDKNTPKVGEIITATFLLKDVNNLAGYQLNIEYDPNVLEPVQSSGEAYKTRTLPGGNTVINNEKFTPLTVASNDPEKGRLCFGRIYLEMASLKEKGISEGSGTLAEISFKVLSEDRTEISFERITTATGTALGAILIDWDGNEVPDYTIQKSVTIN